MVQSTQGAEESPHSQGHSGRVRRDYNSGQWRGPQLARRLLVVSYSHSDPSLAIHRTMYVMRSVFYGDLTDAL
jgi:hypothetical protein